MVTMRDVARQVGCSVATVSRALSGGARVDDLMTQQVRDAAERLGYAAHGRGPRAERLARTRTVGLLIPGLEKFNYTMSMSLMQRMLAQSGYQLLLCCHNESTESERALLRQLLLHRVDAIVHVPTSDQGAATLINGRLPMPVVEFFRKSGDREVDAVVADDRLGSYELVRHLVENGHERIALVADDNEHNSSMSRVDGFSRAIADSDLSFELCPMFFRLPNAPSGGREWGAATLSRILVIAEERRPTAILCTSTHVALGVVEACRRFGLVIPFEMSIVVFSSAEWLDICEPALTRYQNPLKEMGLMAAQLVLNRLDLPSGDELEPSSITFAGKLVIRDSVTSPKGASRLVG